MAMQEGSPANTQTPSAQVVGNAFVEQYYHILHRSPNLVHRFYQDSSQLSRPDIYGNMTTVTTMQAIDEKVLSLNYEDYTAEIKTADAQESYEKGVIVLVTGCLTGKDNVRKKFTQTFFLAPQDKGGYFVLNDVFRYIEEEELQHSVPINGISEQASAASLAPEPEHTHDHLTEPEYPLTYPEEEDVNNGAEVCDPSDKEEGSVIEEEVVEPQNAVSQNESVPTVDSAPVALEDAPKKSYASIVKVMKSNTASAPVYVPTNNVRAAPADQQSIVPAKPAPAPDAAVPNNDNTPESSNENEEAEGHSIYVRNLPYTATPAQLEEAFKKFGPIKPNGIQVRSNKQGFTFGFVEFENASSVPSALEASPITVGDRQAAVEEKRTNTRVGSSGRARYASGKGGFRSDSFRGRGNFGGGRGGYGRTEFRNQGEFPGRPKGSGGRNGDNYQRANLNGRGGRLA
ncbi:hypothetical protein DITRI_Ditri04bG0039800 [Diplodiscus trichospermus]